jgi:hypothetical protein
VANTLVFVGWAHFSLLESMRPDYVHRDRSIAGAARATTGIMGTPCDCPEVHVEVWASDPR